MDLTSPAIQLSFHCLFNVRIIEPQVYNLKACGMTTILFRYAVPSPKLDISSSHDNPISPDTFPTLTCTITLDPSIDRDVQISVSWNGPVYGFGEFTVTSQLFKSSAQVPTYTSTAMLNSHETFYDSGQYRCSAVISSLSNTDLILNVSSTSESISGRVCQ